MHNYKLNNSNSIIVNPEYYNEIKKACVSHGKKSTVCSISPHTVSRAITAAPIASGTHVESKKFGSGEVISTTKSGVMTVRFGERRIKFLYPEVIKNGWIWIPKHSKKHE